MSECIFCEILAGRLPASIVYQDDHCTVFLDINPVNLGHLLVVPNYHASSLAELDATTGGHIFKVGQRMDEALRRSGLPCEGVNLYLADGEAAGQDVFHVHLHVTPRFAGDGFRIVRRGDKTPRPTRAELDRAAEQIKAILQPRAQVSQAAKKLNAGECVREQIRRRVHPMEYLKIRRLWKSHSVAEDGRDIPGLMATLTPDCVYTLVNNGVTWHGHEGATRFYTELLTAFPDIHFDLQNIVIGPQGVFEEAHVTGTHKNQWQSWPATGEWTEFDVNILFPYDPEQELFTGERVFMFLPE